MEEGNNIKSFLTLSVLGLFLAIALVLLPILPQYLSFQDRINPDYILGDTTDITLPNGSIRRIEVDLTTQHLYGFENNQKIFDFLISSGKWDRTPTGTFYIWTKVRSQKMSGGSQQLGTYYYLPNVPYIMFFYNDKTAKKLGFSLHGTYWHDNFGVPMSHGCINMRTNEAALIYNWAPVGTPVTIYGKYSGII